MDNNNFRTFSIVLTGGIACGKTAISDNFKKLQVPVFDTDVISRELTGKDQPLLLKLKKTFGEDIISPSGELDRRALRLKVFGNEKALATLNMITHPAIMNELRRRIKECSAPYAISVIPLFFEGQNQDIADRVLVADVNEQTQLQRLIERDHIDEKTAMNMIASQVSRKYRRDHADDLIETDHTTLDEIKEAVIKLHSFYLTLNKNKKPD